jgi:hypothetical protein
MVSSRSIRLWTVVAATTFLAVALGIRAAHGGLEAGGALAQYSGTALYASMVYAGVVFLWPRLAPPFAGAAAVAFCWLVEFAQLTGVPATLSARSLVARLVLGVHFDWTDVAWYPVGVLPLVAVDWVLGLRTRRAPAQSATTDR